jgi:translation initiation factor IF-2
VDRLSASAGAPGRESAVPVLRECSVGSPPSQPPGAPARASSVRSRRDPHPGLRRPFSRECSAGGRSSASTGMVCPCSRGVPPGDGLSVLTGGSRLGIASTCPVGLAPEPRPSAPARDPHPGSHLRPLQDPHPGSPVHPTARAPSRGHPCTPRPGPPPGVTRAPRGQDPLPRSPVHPTARTLTRGHVSTPRPGPSPGVTRAPHGQDPHPRSPVHPTARTPTRGHPSTPRQNPTPKSPHPRPGAHPQLSG